MEYPVAVGDRIQTRKPHACGTSEWDVTRIGADIGIKCVGCGRRIMLTRRDYFKAVKKLIKPGLSPSSSEPLPPQSQP